MEAANFFILEAKDVSNRDAMPDWMKVEGNTRIGPESGKLEYHNGADWTPITPNSQVFFIDMMSGVESEDEIAFDVKTYFSSDKPIESMANPYIFSK